MRINEKLKRCPFCGGDVEIRACDDESEGLGGWIYESIAEAEASWNRRAHEEGNR